MTRRQLRQALARADERNTELAADLTAANTRITQLTAQRDHLARRTIDLQQRNTVLEGELATALFRAQDNQLWGAEQLRRAWAAEDALNGRTGAVTLTLVDQRGRHHDQRGRFTRAVGQ